MSGWEIATLALLVGGMVPALVLVARGGPVDRLVGLELASAVGALTLLVMIQGDGQSSYLIVPLVLVLLGFAGTLVYTRLLGPKP
ncbi:monovalent cation/H+ antiporter complex subunit F [Kutzneria kofuensis]|uniref:Multisubunit Na+/H+ antiporter MnhF subunit n=1 Tax=Kutzneria kofuensis TaxID=103725 RepID=A0A7W9KR87_9PSEU|nr:monovalent cation/H+ antiporter complex subunit F [Kutzneria kofuensis]MBB5897162.1 multisubunit Na+/H+ antiporter MnhF subunit [Kutzneria kofuensis]